MVPCVLASASVWQPPHFAANSCLPLETSALAPALETPPVPHAVTRNGVRSAAQRAIARRNADPLAGRSAAVELRERVVARGINREHAVEARDLEALRDVSVGADERQLP